jgi:hypothetical protein
VRPYFGRYANGWYSGWYVLFMAGTLYLCMTPRGSRFLGYRDGPGDDWMFGLWFFAFGWETP